VTWWFSTLFSGYTEKTSFEDESGYPLSHQTLFSLEQAGCYPSARAIIYVK